MGIGRFVWNQEDGARGDIQGVGMYGTAKCPSSSLVGLLGGLAGEVCVSPVPRLGVAVGS